MDAEPADPGPEAFGARLPTGVPNLDVILGGGPRRGSLTVALGVPGTGKTILAQQVSFHLARHGATVLYFTGFSEPHEKLIAYARELAFFDPALVGTRVQLFSLPDVLRASADEVVKTLTATARKQEAELIVIDGFRGLRPLVEGAPIAPSELLYRLSAQLALQGTSLLVLMEGEPEERDRFPELTVADVVIALRRERRGFMHRRLLEVVKARGAAALIGFHPYRIDADGITVYPRLESIVSDAEPAFRDAPAGFGHAALDALLGGGLSVGTTTLMAGSPGSGKTHLGLQFLTTGAEAGEPGLFLGFMESAGQLRAAARAFHRDVEGPERTGQLRLLTLPSYEVEADEVALRVRDDIERRGVRRLVIDSVAELAHAAGDGARQASFLGALVRELRAREVTTYMTLDVSTVAGSELAFANTPLSVVAENLVLLRQVEFHGRLRRFLAVLKMRFSSYDPIIFEYAIASGTGLYIIGPAPAAAGLFTGLAHPLAPSESTPRADDDQGGAP